ncbi:MAG: M56 family metallopeptidase [Saprospiraceae bacterium]|nr:M56 family metallopeptidase [Saprospiraceae bacterium]MBP9193281.1 M56 family metallopeptidase [Saprospiraceae bacterium]
MVLFNYINPAYYAIAWTVMHAIWQVALVVLLTAGCQAAIKNMTATMRYAIWVSSLVLILGGSVATFMYYYNLDPALLLLEEPTQISVAATSETDLTATLIVSPTKNPFTLSSVVAYVNEHILFIVMLWLVGMIIALIRLLGNIGYVEYLKNKFNFPVDPYWEELLQSLKSKMGISKNVQLLESALVMSPMVIGHLKPVIFFPMGAINRLSAQEVEAILAHELAHIMRNDYIINLLVSCIESLYYFHPAMWWLTAQIRAEREHCCDDLAIKATGQPIQYAHSLVAVQEMTMMAPRLAMQFAGKEKKSRFFFRVNRLIRPNSVAMSTREKTMAAVVTAFMVLVVAMASKPVDSAAHCLPLTSPGNENYLKYDGEYGLDSLALDFAISDGVYHYNDHYYHAEMEVINRKVVSLILNGLKISGSDVNRFGNLIRDILLAEQQPGNKEKDITTSSNFYDVFANQLMKDEMLPNNKLNEVVFNHSGLVINGEEQSRDVWQRYLNMYHEQKSQDMPAEPNINIDIYPDENGTIVQANLIGLDKNKISEKENNLHAKDNEEVKPSEVKSYGWRSADDVFNDWLEKELDEDGYIFDLEEYNYVWTESMFVVDGENVDEADVIKYVKKAEEITGKKMDKSFIKTKNVTKD